MGEVGVINKIEDQGGYLNMTFKIAMFDAKSYDRNSFEETNKDFGFELEYFEPKLSEQTVSLAKGFDAVCIFVNDTVTSEVIDKLQENGIKLIALRCAGYNNIDFKAAYKKINVVRVPAYSPYAVAEFAVAMLLGLNRKLHRAHNRTREGNFSLNGLLGFDLHGKTAGIVGTGKIARCLISILKGFGVNILAYDPYQDNEYAKTTGITYCSLDELFRNSDFISLHCPLTDESFHMINAESIDKMKPNCIIINTGRGKLIDSKALLEALVTQKIAGACLDVYEEESNFFYEDKSGEPLTDDVLARFVGLPNVLLTSHQAYFTQEALNNIANTTLNNIKAFTDGKPLENEICYKCNKTDCAKKTKGRCF